MRNFDPSKFEPNWSLRARLVDTMNVLENIVQVLRQENPKTILDKLEGVAGAVGKMIEETNIDLGMSALVHFQGKGLVASRLRQRLEEEKFLFNIPDPAILAAEKRLEAFNFHPIDDVEEVQKVSFATMEAFPITMQKVKDFPIKEKLNQYDLTRLGVHWFEPGLYEIEMDDLRPGFNRLLVFEGVLPNNPNLEVNFALIGYHPPIIMFRHKLEDFDAVFDNSYTFEGLDEFIRENVRTLLHKYGMDNVRDYDLEFSVMKQKVRMLFDHVELLDQSYINHQVVEKDCHHFTFPIGALSFVFRFSRYGTKIVESASIIVEHGPTVTLSTRDISEEERPFIFNSVMAQIDTMVDRINKQLKQNLLIQH